MGKGSSSSSSSQTTSTSSTTNTTDIGAQGGGIAIGAGGSYIEDLSPNAVSVINRVVDFSGGVLEKASQIISDAQAAAAASVLQAENLGQNAVNANSDATAKAIQAATDATAKSIAASSLNTGQALSTANQSLNNAQLGQSAIFTNPMFLIAAIGGLGLILYLSLKRRS